VRSLRERVLVGLDPKPGAKTPRDDRGGSPMKSVHEAIKKHQEKEYVLKLYVAGTTPRSNQAIMAVKRVCKENLEGRCTLQVIDISLQPALAKMEQIIAVPMLIKRQPSPMRRFVGSMANTERILIGLDLKPKERPA
jgi:circadian clock protein KaiB